MRIAISSIVNCLIILSTIHSQNFRDQVGEERAERWATPVATMLLTAQLVEYARKSDQIR
jgi:hypothetical protein